MFVLSNFIMSIAKVLDIVITLLYWMIIIKALISWVNPDPFNPIVQFLQRATEPL
jgi:YggT family protein